MPYHPILNSQINKYLPDNALANETLITFLDKVSKSYYSFEKAQRIAEHAFNISEKEYQEINISLIKSKEVAEEALLTKSQFLSTMSHEIRTPLNAVIGFTQLLQKDHLNPTQTEYLNLLRFSSENLLTLINNILDFSKIEAGKICLEQMDLNLRDFLNKIHGTLLQSALEKNIGLEFIIDPALPQIINGDPGRLTQIFTNLIANAIKFTVQGKITITALLVNQNEENTTINFKVTDTGIGIEADKLNLIFESFTQANNDTTRKFGGTGLGLSITKKLLGLMDSEVKVESEVGKGSIFTFTIKFKTSSPDFPSQAKVPEYFDLKDIKGLKFLVVDDNSINLIIIKRFLHGWNIATEEAENGKIALEKIKATHFDMVMMDLQMPVMDGYEATKAIRTMPGNYYKNLPVIAFTASALIETKDKILKLGMNDFINKPFKHQDLHQKICLYVPQMIANRNALNVLH